MSATVHIPTKGYVVPPENAGSNPLAIGSDYHLGPAIELFGVGFTPDTGVLNFDDLFDSTKNPLLLEPTSDNLVPLVSAASDVGSPFRLVIRVNGVCYCVPPSIATRIRGGRRGRKVHWRTTNGVEGFFRFFRSAPPVFK